MISPQPSDTEQQASENTWTVLVLHRSRVGIGQWSAWSEWVDRATAEAEARVARHEGYLTKIRPAAAGGTS